MLEALPSYQPPPRRSVLEREGSATAWEVLLAIRLLHRRLEVAMDQAISAYGVSFAQFRALQLIDERPSYVSYLARQLRVTRQASDAVTAKLELAGLISRTRLGNVTELDITPDGTAQLAKMRRLLASLVERPLQEALDARELFAFTQLLHEADRAVKPSYLPTWWLEN